MQTNLWKIFEEIREKLRNNFKELFRKFKKKKLGTVFWLQKILNNNEENIKHRKLQKF